MLIALLATVAVDTVADTVYKRLRYSIDGNCRQVCYVRIENNKPVLPLCGILDVIIKIVAGACGIIKNFLFGEFAVNVTRKAVYCAVAARQNNCIVARSGNIRRNIGDFCNILKRYSVSIGFFQLFSLCFAVFVISKRVVKSSYHFESLLFH